jgi:hypothetical protein
VERVAKPGQPVAASQSAPDHRRGLARFRDLGEQVLGRQ